MNDLSNDSVSWHHCWVVYWSTSKQDWRRHFIIIDMGRWSDLKLAALLIGIVPFKNFHLNDCFFLYFRVMSKELIRSAVEQMKFQASMNYLSRQWSVHVLFVDCKQWWLHLFEVRWYQSCIKNKSSTLETIYLDHSDSKIDTLAKCRFYFYDYLPKYIVDTLHAYFSNDLWPLWLDILLIINTAILFEHNTLFLIKINFLFFNWLTVERPIQFWFRLKLRVHLLLFKINH